MLQQFAYHSRWWCIAALILVRHCKTSRAWEIWCERRVWFLIHFSTGKFKLATNDSVEKLIVCFFEKICKTESSLTYFTFLYIN